MDIATITGISALCINIATMLGVFIKLEHRLTKLETMQTILLREFKK